MRLGKRRFPVPAGDEDTKKAAAEVARTARFLLPCFGPSTPSMPIGPLCSEEDRCNSCAGSWAALRVLDVKHRETSLDMGIYLETSDFRDLGAPRRVTKPLRCSARPSKSTRPSSLAEVRRCAKRCEAFNIQMSALRCTRTASLES